MSSTNMDTTTKSIAALVIAVLIFGGVFYEVKLLTPSTQLAGTSAGGSTGSTARQATIYGISLATPGANATSSSILNTSSNDYYPTSIIVGCEGVGTSKTAYAGGALAALTLSVGTSSVATPAVIPGTLVSGAAVTIATSSPQFELNTVVTSSSLGGAVWPAGSYMTFWANATNTAVCSFGVTYTSS